MTGSGRSPPKESIAAHLATTGRAGKAILCGAAPPGLSRPLHHLRHCDDGRQYRARHQLLDGVPEVPLFGTCGLRGADPLAAVPAVLGRDRRARRSFRSAQDHPMRHGAVHHRFAWLGLFFRHRHLGDLASHGAAGDPWLCRRVVADAEPVAALRHRRPRGSSERRAAQRDSTLPRHLGGSGGRRRAADRARTVAWASCSTRCSICRWCSGS